MSRDSKDGKDPAKVQQQTRLNHELAHRYAQPGGRRKKPGPGQSSLTEDLSEPTEAEVEAAEPEVAEEQQAEAPQVATEPRRSIFELPRKETTKSALPSTAPTPPAAPAAPAAPATPSKPGPTGSGSSGSRRR